jgi:hypothetical protein
MVRRCFALLTWLFMAHLTFVGGDLACANHPGDTAGMHHATAHHEHAASNPEHAENDEAPCRTPLIPMCCQALQSCTVVVVMVEAGSVHRVSIARASASPSESEIPPSEIIAPDPPPPRA